MGQVDAGWSRHLRDSKKKTQQNRNKNNHLLGKKEVKEEELGRVGRTDRYCTVSIGGGGATNQIILVNKMK